GPQHRRRRPQARESRSLPEQGEGRGAAQSGRRRRRGASAEHRAMSEPDRPRLRAEHLTKSFVGRRVVNDVTIEVEAGEVVGLLGPNGAGKTTSFHMIGGLTRPDAGTVLLRGEDVTALPMYARARRGIGYLPQEPSVFRKLSVEENIRAILETLD